MSAPKKSRGILFEPAYRNQFEKRLGKQLEGTDVPFSFEPFRIPYSVPARTANYLPDLVIDNTPIIIEGKGWFGRSGAKERQKFILLKQQHPEYDIRFVFTDASKKIYKNSPTTYAKWAGDNGFLWADKGVIPTKWLQEMKQWKTLSDKKPKSSGKSSHRSQP